MSPEVRLETAASAPPLDGAVAHAIIPAQSALFDPGANADELSAVDSATSTPMRMPNIRNLILARSGSAFGAWVQVAAASWYVMDRTGSASAVGLLVALMYVPSIPGSLVSGWLMSRYSIRRLCIVLNTLEAIPVAAITVLMWTGHLPLPALYVLALLSALPNALLGPPQAAMPLAAAPRTMRHDVVADSSIGYSIAKLSGPIVGGVLTGLFGPASAFLVNTISYCVCALVAASAKLPYLSEVVVEGQTQSRFVPAVRTGMGIPLGQVAMLGALVFFSLVAPILQLMPSIAGVSSTGPYRAGILLAAVAAGGICGNKPIRAFLKSEGSPIRAIQVGFALGGLGLVGLGYFHLFALSMIFLVLVGIGWEGVWVASQAAIQIHLPVNARAHMMGVYYATVSAGTAFGAIVLGHLYAALGVHEAMLLVGLLVCAYAVAGHLTWDVLPRRSRPMPGTVAMVSASATRRVLETSNPHEVRPSPVSAQAR